MRKIHFCITFLFISLGYCDNTECGELQNSDSTFVSQAKTGKITEISGPDINIYVNEINEPVTIDGILDDHAWEKALPYNEYFFQHEPLDRVPSSEKQN